MICTKFFGDTAFRYAMNYLPFVKPSKSTDKTKMYFIMIYCRFCLN